MTDPYVPIWEEDRKPLDSRRLIALVIDSLLVGIVVVIPLTLIFGRLTYGAWLIYTACTLTYFHVMETRIGQTVGKRLMDLRVVRADDAGPASAVAISGRTILRLIDALPSVYIVGFISMIATGKRRRRLGDLAGGTVVTRASARPYTPARRSPLVSIYPAAWIGAAVAVVLAVGHNGDPYLVAMDQLCEQARIARADDKINREWADVIGIDTVLWQRINDLSGKVNTEARDALLGTLTADINFERMMAARFQQTRNESEWRENLMTLGDMNVRHGKSLHDDYGLDHCY